MMLEYQGCVSVVYRVGSSVWSPLSIKLSTSNKQMALTFVTGGFKSQPLSFFNFQQIERGKTRLFLMDLLLKVCFHF